MNNIILASNSKRREEILKMLISDFEIIPANIDENFDNNMNVIDVPTFLAVQKALNVYKSNNFKDDCIIIGADTMVVLENKLIGKPKNFDDAKKILQKLSNKKHKVVTGLAFIQNAKTFSSCCVTEVYIDKISDKEIVNYITKNNPYDKAGAYAIQDDFSIFVKEIKGDYLNIVGLPINKVKNVLQSKFNCKFY